MVGIEDGEEDKTCGTPDGADDGADREDLFQLLGITCETACVSKPALGDEGEVEEDGGNDSPCDEQRFQSVSTHV